ncbi:uncharacterized protein LOC108670605 isoform X1 [Hyalella azteca]|uniref:Uncharacterized protein LOC108670605 isoform X1 n=2 Tax=Hyalella azteca TaxID=294128 RepID=A0A8B7NIU2_HYAAZ|nr:uncharacterized protein LOC108670605 isoform X1 [Hyalella azteca]XP_018013562.1 uncharacterized protein LOC108670605 isoform X1 [Hyalella azteca]XP_018013563.1 uncharacterized protein LOC108670605 isoform X1 [Hyalella azteca]
MSSKFEKLNKYVGELKCIKQQLINTPMLDKLLDAEILSREKIMRNFALENKRHELLKSIAKVQEILTETSQQSFRQHLEKQMASLQEEVDLIQIGSPGVELPADEFKKRLIECEETIAITIYKLESQAAAGNIHSQTDNDSTRS